MTRFPLKPAIAAFALCSLLTRNGKCQSTPDELVKFLTYQSGRQFSYVERKLPVRQDRATTRVLVSLGTEAIPSLDAALDSIEANGPGAAAAFNSRWLLFAYAAIKRASAVPMLSRMLENKKIGFLTTDLDYSLAIALDLTSYVSSSRAPDDFVCCRAGVPRDALDQFILGWERNDRGLMELQLSSQAKADLTSPLVLPPATTQSTRGKVRSVGFRFRGPGPWSDPPETLDQNRQDFSRFVHEEQFPNRVELESEFVGDSGRNCGHSRLKFIRSPGKQPAPWFNYLIDEPDLRGLFALLAACSAK